MIFTIKYLRVGKELLVTTNSVGKKLGDNSWVFARKVTKPPTPNLEMYIFGFIKKGVDNEYTIDGLDSDGLSFDGEFNPADITDSMYDRFREIYGESLSVDHIKEPAFYEVIPSPEEDELGFRNDPLDDAFAAIKNKRFDTCSYVIVSGVKTSEGDPVTPGEGGGGTEEGETPDPSDPPSGTPPTETDGCQLGYPETLFEPTQIKFPSNLEVPLNQAIVVTYSVNGQPSTTVVGSQQFINQVAFIGSEQTFQIHGNKDSCTLYGLDAIKPNQTSESHDVYTSGIKQMDLFGTNKIAKVDSVSNRCVEITILPTEAGYEGFTDLHSIVGSVTLTTLAKAKLSTAVELPTAIAYKSELTSSESSKLTTSGAALKYRINGGEWIEQHLMVSSLDELVGALTSITLDKPMTIYNDWDEPYGMAVIDNLTLVATPYAGYHTDSSNWYVRYPVPFVADSDYSPVIRGFTSKNSSGYTVKLAEQTTIEISADTAGSALNVAKALFGGSVRFVSYGFGFSNSF